MQLFDNALSPYALKVRIALYEKGLPFESRELRTLAQREDLLRVNPRGEVPALEDEGALITDSPIICQYLEAKHPAQPLFPRDPFALSRCLSVQRLSDTAVDAVVFMIVLGEHVRPDLYGAFPALRDELRATLTRLFERLDGLLEGHEYFAGDFSVADIALVPHFALAKSMGHAVDKEAFPRLLGWLRRVSSRPSVMRALGEMAATAAASKSGSEPLFNATHIHWRNDRIECAVRLGLGAWLHGELAKGSAFLSVLA